MNVEPAPRQLLPVSAYTSPEWHQREQAELFGRVWAFGGMAEDLPAPGDYQIVQAGPHSLILLRDRDGGLAAFHNTCRHRGTRLLEGRGNVGRSITCFYHNWSYDLSGRLLGMAHEADQFPGLDKSCLGLHPAKVAQWRNLLFLHPDPAAEPLEDWLADFADTLGPHDPQALVEISDVLYRVRANWKIVIENFIDGYHLSQLHKVSLGDGDFSKQRWRPAGRHWTFYRPLKEGVSHDNQTLPVVAGVPANFGAGAYVLFPNIALYETATYWMTFHVLPVDAATCHVHARVRAMPEALNRTNRAPAEEPLSDHIISAKGPYASMRLNLTGVHPLKSNNIMLEDIYACEAVQAGMAQPGCSIGPLARFESPLPFFQRQLLDYVPL